MSFPYRDTLGEVYLDILSELNLAQRQKEFKKSVTPEEFVQHSQGKNFEQLNSELPPRTLIHKPVPIVVDGGVASEFRYVKDPTEPGGVIDMLHFTSAARWPLGLGEQIGFAIELNQARKGNRSAFQRSDIRSNFYGAVFRNNYFDPNGDLNQQFQEFFTDLKNGELKGFAPAFEYFLDDVIDLAKDAQRALQQLQGVIDLHIAHANDSESAQKLRDLMDSLRGFVELPAYARDTEGGFNQATAQGRPPYTDPLVLDLDGDGIELTSVDNYLVRFDIDADGFQEATGWVHSDDGLLVLDRNGDGLINDISELFGNEATSGFVALREIDNNADGLIDTADTKFSALQVWRDLDSDGRSDGNELFSLDELGISRIRTAANSTNITNAGNQITETSHFELADGSQREIANVGFSVEQLNSYYDPYSTFSKPVVFTAEILSLPNLRGYGNLPDLQIAMATDEQLLARVRSFTEEMSGDVSSAGERIRSILLRWAVVDGVAPTSRGSNVNAQELGFLEKFLGSSYPQNLTITTAAGQTLSQTYKQLASALGTRLIAQAAEVPVEYDASSDQLVFNGDTNAALLQLKQVIAQSLSSPSAQLDLEISVLRQLLGEREEWILGSESSEQLVGSTGEDRLYGFSGNDTLSASGGNDLLEGGAGNDTLIGGVGSDTLIGGTGNDSLNGGEGNDTYRFTGGDGQDVIHDFYQPYYIEPGGTDTLVFDGGITKADLNWSFDGTNLTFTVAGSSDQVTIRSITDTRHQVEQFVIAGETLSLNEVMTNWVGTGTAGADSLTWGQSAIILNGLAGNDTITSGNYADKLYGGEGNDTLSANGGNDSLEGGAGNDTLIGGVGSDTLIGGTGNDSLNGGEGSDTLIGGTGNDSLNGGEGNDTYRFTGGDGQDIIHDFYQPYYIEPGGTDTLVFDGAITKADLSWSFDGTNLTFTVAGSSDQVTIRSITDTRHQVEQFVIAGETLSLSEVMTNWVGTGTAGADSLTWGQSAIVLDGIAGNDTITSGNYADKLYGGEGNDTLSANGGNDSLEGGAGNDTLIGGVGSDTLIGGTGNDSLNGGEGSDTLIGGTGNDSLNGGEGNDTYRFTGGDGQDVIHDFYQPYYIEPGGTDTLVFDGGITKADLNWSFDGTNLTLTVAGSSDQVTIRSITDTRHQVEQFVIAGETLSLSEVMTNWVGTGTAGADSLTWGQSAIVLDGVAGNDTITSGNYADKLYGGEGNDTLSANGGNDSLEGGAGNDTLIGGVGSDTLIGGTGNDSLNGGEGNDTYRFTGGDGQDIIHDFYQPYYVEPGGTDTLVFDGGITKADLSWSFDGTNLTFTVTGSSDQVKIQNITDTRHQVEQFVIAGKTLSLSEVMTNWVGIGTVGVDNLTWGQSAIVLDGIAGNDTITSGNYADKLYGGEGNDILPAGAGDDVLDGGIGNDTLNGGNGTDQVVESGNVNFILTNTSLTGNGTDSLTSIETATLTGGSGDNTIDASVFTLGAVTLDSGAGSDILIGGSGNDILVGGFGNDTLTGGAGADQFLHNSAVGWERITDFTSGSDKLVLEQSTFTALTSVAGSGFSVESEWAVVANDAAATTSGGLIAYSSATGNLFYNQNGAADGFGSGGQFATLTNIPGLTAADFILQV